MMPRDDSVARLRSGRPTRRRRRGGGGGGGIHVSWQPQSQQQSQSPQQGSPVVPPYTDYDRAYFRAYSHTEVHEEMIKDRVRTQTYVDAIEKYQHLIVDKVVLDVGCGTGILAIFCAFSGAKRVYAVDASEIAVQANQVVKENNLSDRVTVLLGRVEDVSIDEKVDVIVSEWMGYMLLYESMLPSIIFARDKWLKPGGLILPSHALLFMAPFTHADRYHESVGFWHNVHEINMSTMMQVAKQCTFEEPCIETISVENVMTWPILVKKVDCYTVTIQELESVTADFSVLSMLQEAPLHGFAFWFDVTFNGPAISASDPVQKSQGSKPTNKRIRSDEGILLSTSPHAAPTHWQQTLLYLYNPIVMRKGEEISGSVTLSQNMVNRRFLNISLIFTAAGQSRGRIAVMR